MVFVMFGDLLWDNANFRAKHLIAGIFQPYIPYVHMIISLSTYNLIDCFFLFITLEASTSREFLDWLYS